MDSELFEEWVREQDRKFALQRRKVALDIDNCTAQPNIENVKSITLYFLSSNTTSYLQPMDRGVIRSLRCKYRTRIIKTCINAIGNGKQIPSMSILEAMKMFAHSWSEVSEINIINCILIAGFNEGVSDEDDDPFSAFKNSVDQLWQSDENLIPNDFTKSYSEWLYKDILTVDDDIAVLGGVMADEEIVQNLTEVAKEDVQEKEWRN